MYRRLKHTEIPAIRAAIQKAQNNQCAICEVYFNEAKLVGKRLVKKHTPTLDHDHETGLLRGVLCSNCNGNEGRIKKRALSAKRMGTYLEWLVKLVAYLTLYESSGNVLVHPNHKTTDEKRLFINKKARNKRRRIKAAKLLKTGK